MFRRFAVACLLGTNLLSVPTFAADATADGRDWTGVYAGLHGGYGTTSVKGIYDSPDIDDGDEFVDDGEGTFAMDDQGMLGGAQLGFNYQNGAFVYGLEADISKSGWSDQAEYLEDYDRLAMQTDWNASLRLRLGVASGPALLFITGGMGYQATQFIADDDIEDSDADQEGSVDFRDVMPVAGGGVEYAIADHWTIKADGLYFFGGEKIDTADIMSEESKQGDEVEMKGSWSARFGINYRF